MFWDDLDEKEVAQEVLSSLHKHFYIRLEVTGVHCTGKRLRIDALLKPRDPSLWLDGEDSLIGIEFKSTISDRNKLATQAIDYTHVEWDISEPRRCLIFCCPEPWTTGRTSYSTLSQRDHSLSRILGRLGVGGIGVTGQGYYYLHMSGSPFWKPWLNGPISGEYRVRSTYPKAGSR